MAPLPTIDNSPPTGMSSLFLPYSSFPDLDALSNPRLAPATPHSAENAIPAPPVQGTPRPINTIVYLE